MATTTISSSPPARTATTTRLLRLMQGWHGLLALACLAALPLLWGLEAERPLLRLLGLAAAALGALFNADAVRLIGQQRHRGRTTSLSINYIGMVASLLYGLHVLGFYTGIDAFASSFQRAAPLLLGVVVGYLIYTWGDRYSGFARTQRSFQRVGGWIMLIAGALTLLFSGLFQGLLYLLLGLRDPLALALITATALFGVAFALMWRSDLSRAFGATSRHAEMLNGYLFVAPNVLGFLLFFAGPLLFSLYLSFTDSDAFTASLVGVENYQRIFSLDVARLDSPTQRASEVLAPGYVELERFGGLIVGARDKLFWISLWNTIVYCVFTTILSVVPALLLANLLNTKMRGRGFFRATYFLPSIAGVVGVAVVWKLLYNSNVGFLNYGINQLIGALNLLPGLSLAQVEIPWLASQSTALPSIILMGAWQLLGFNIVLFLAGLQTIPGQLYEAATIDGANKGQQFFRITLPLLAPTTFFVMTTTLIRTLQVFDEVVVMTPPPGGGPNNATLTSVLYLYQAGFKNFEQGYAAAVAWVLFLFIFALTVVQFRLQRGNETDLA
jgi:ABC-type sugar transport system permease subunit